MTSVSDAFRLGLDHHVAGRLDAAEQLYQIVLAAEPDHAGATEHLGLILHQRGDPAAALPWLEKAVVLSPHESGWFANLGLVYHLLGRLDDAETAYRHAVDRQPALGIAWTNYGTLLVDRQRHEEGLAALGRALVIQPESFETHISLATALVGLGRLEEAALHARTAARLRPADAAAYFKLGVIAYSLGKTAEAVEAFQTVTRLDRTRADAWSNLGILYDMQGRLDRARDAYWEAIAADPRHVEAHANFAALLAKAGRHEESIEACRHALALDPRSVDATNNLATALMNVGDIEASREWYDKAVELDPTAHVAHSNALRCLQYGVGANLADLAFGHAGWNERHAEPLRRFWPRFDDRRQPERPLRLGFVSPDLGRHPVGYFLVGVLESLRELGWHTVCYSDRTQCDEMTDRLKAAATAWRDIRGQKMDGVAALMVADRIDVLFDLAGHTADNRLLALARKPAPLQMSWMGYVGSTGLWAMDYVVADRFHVPPAAEPFYTERVLRLPDGYITWLPPAEAPAVDPSPAAARGHAAFGCFNNPSKINDRVIAVWSRLLQRLPDARLVLKYGGMADPATVERLHGRFTEAGVARQRVELLDWSTRAEVLALYNQIDVALDTFPYSGGLTTLEALWMGVPVVTLPGETFSARHSFSHLSNAGLAECIAADEDDYVERAAMLAADRPRLAHWRRTLREQVARSPLCDHRRLTEALTRALRDIWRQWCDGGLTQDEAAFHENLAGVFAARGDEAKAAVCRRRAGEYRERARHG